MANWYDFFLLFFVFSSPIPFNQSIKIDFATICTLHTYRRHKWLIVFAWNFWFGGFPFSIFDQCAVIIRGSSNSMYQAKGKTRIVKKRMWIWMNTWLLLAQSRRKHSHINHISNHLFNYQNGIQTTLLQSATSKRVVENSIRIMWIIHIISETITLFKRNFSLNNL